MTALICLTYDDALAVHRETVAPELNERGMHGTFYIPVAREDLFSGLEGWRKAAEMGHELGNHSCWHPCRGWPTWLPRAYYLEDYDRVRIREELLLANRVLGLVDGGTVRTYGSTCGDLTIGPGQGESFLEDIRDLFTLVRSGHSDRPQSGPMPFVAPLWPVDGCRAEDLIAVIETMRDVPDSWMILGMHGVDAGTHGSFMDAKEHRRLIDWIAAQCDWLEAVTVQEAAQRRGVLKEG